MSPLTKFTLTLYCPLYWAARALCRQDYQNSKLVVNLDQTQCTGPDIDKYRGRFIPCNEIITGVGPRSTLEAIVRFFQCALLFLRPYVITSCRLLTLRVLWIAHCLHVCSGILTKLHLHGKRSHVHIWNEKNSNTLKKMKFGLDLVSS